MLTIYKILFEVRLLHEFYMTKADGSVIFSKAAAADRAIFLQNLFAGNQRSVNSDVSYIIPAGSVHVFQAQKLKLVQTYSGFKIGIEVDRVTDAGKTAYRPVAPLPPQLNIPVSIVRSGTSIDSITNRRMYDPVERIYYLSNDNTGGLKTAPFLSNAIAASDPARVYEQGELARSAGVVSAFYMDAGNMPQWAPVTGSNFINEGDRLLVSATFRYSFAPTDNVRQASFDIRDKANVSVYAIQVNSGLTPLQAVEVRVDPKKISFVPGGIVPMLYTLTVTGDGGYNKRYNLLFLSDEAAGEEPWAFVNMISRPADAAYRLIDDKGLLMTRINPDGSIAIAPPVFEVWIKSRFSFWRYMNDLGNKLKDSHSASLAPSGNDLVTKIPVNHSYAPVPVSGDRIPNPVPFSLVKPVGRKIFSDIIVPESDIFPLGP